MRDLMQILDFFYVQLINDKTRASESKKRNIKKVKRRMMRAQDEKDGIDSFVLSVEKSSHRRDRTRGRNDAEEPGKLR